VVDSTCSCKPQTDTVGSRVKHLHSTLSEIGWCSGRDSNPRSVTFFALRLERPLCSRPGLRQVTGLHHRSPAANQRFHALSSFSSVQYFELSKFSSPIFPSNVQVLHIGSWWSASAEFDLFLNLFLLTLEQSLDAAVRQISDPPADSEALGKICGFRPEEDPLNLAAHVDPRSNFHVSNAHLCLNNGFGRS